MRRRLLALIFAVALVCSIFGSAQTSATCVAPRLIRYNAALPGNPPIAETGAIGVTFSIYRDQFDGAPLWSEIQNVQADTKGGYSVLLGSTRNEGLPIELFNTSETRWLEVETMGRSSRACRSAAFPMQWWLKTPKHSVDFRLLLT